MTTRKYTVHLTGIVSTTIRVEVPEEELERLASLEDGELATLEGKDLEEVWRSAALERAFQVNQATLCHRCSSHMEEPHEWHPGNWTMGPETLTESVVQEGDPS